MTPLRLALLLLFVVIGSLTPQRASALSIEAVRIGAHPDKIRLVFDLDQVTDFRAFLLQNPNRLVIDLPNFDWRAAPPPRKGIIRDIRTGQLQDGMMRIVLDINQPVILLSAFLLPRNKTLPERLVVDFRPARPEEAGAQKDKVLGTLDSAGAPPSMQENDFSAAPGLPVVPGRKPSATLIKPLVVIDAGHGGQDPGAVAGKGRYEKHVTLATAIELKRQLEASGRYRVKLTRESDKFIKLNDRVLIARKAGADLFLSIHADSLDKPSVRGASIYTLSNTASDAQTAKLAARENKADLIGGVDLSHEDKDVANILIDLAMRDTMNQSKFLANRMVDHFKGNNIQMLEKPHRFAGFAVLKAADIPSILVEIGFMSNKAEAEALNSAAYQKKIAKALKDGVDAYFAKVQKNNKS